MEFPAEEGGGHTASPDEHASPAGTKEAVAAQGDPTELASSEVVQFKPNESDLLQGQDLQPFDGKSHNVERAKKMEHEQAVQAKMDKHEAIKKHGILERDHKERAHTVWWKLDDIDMEVGCCLPSILLTMSS